MRCIECDALLSEYRVATERYAVLSGMLERAGVPEAFQDLEYQKLKDEVAEARLNCHRASRSGDTGRHVVRAVMRPPPGSSACPAG